MPTQEWLRSWIGFGFADFIALAAAIVLSVVALRLPRFTLPAPRFAARTGWCVLAIALLAIVLRLALLGRCPVPYPAGADDFSYLLLADTLRHLRLANPPHPFPQFFEAVFVLQQPTYSSIFPLGQGIVLALGWILFATPWAGVVIASGAFCGLCYWMLRGWVSAGWAVAGGLLAVMQFGPLCQWTNLYWGGAVSACAGCLVFGAIPRLDRSSRLAPVLLGCGVGLQLLARPFECALLAVCLVPILCRLRARVALVAIAVMPGLILTLLHNRSVTGNWTTMPYQLSRYEYGVPTTFTFQPKPVPHRELTREQEMDYRAQSILHGDGETPRAYAVRWLERLRFYRFFLYPPLYLALVAFLPALRDRRYLWVAATLAVFSFGTNFYPYFYPHYIAVLACLFVLAGIVGLERLSRRAPIGLLLLCLCGAQFLFWYGFHAVAPETTLNALGRHESWDFINHGDPDGRIAVGRELSRAPGRQLVFIHYAPGHLFHEWIHNDADIDAQRVVRAADLGPVENELLLRRYPDRTAWILEPDRVPPRLTPYPREVEPPPVPSPPPPAANSRHEPPRPPLRFDEGPVHNPGGIQEMQRKRR